MYPAFVLQGAVAGRYHSGPQVGDGPPDEASGFVGWVVQVIVVSIPGDLEHAPFLERPHYAGARGLQGVQAHAPDHVPRQCGRGRQAFGSLSGDPSRGAQPTLFHGLMELAVHGPRVAPMVQQPVLAGAQVLSQGKAPRIDALKGPQVTVEVVEVEQV